MNIVTLITGCIKPDANVYQVSVRDESERFRQYIESIKFYITDTVCEKIVFCDNSNTPMPEDLVSFAQKYGKCFEWITFQGDAEKCIEKGKGYGEGEIVAYALKKSILLSKADIFCKITGRLKILNINYFLRMIKSDKIYLFTPSIRMNVRNRMVDTRFYAVSRIDYKQLYENLYLRVDDRNGIYLEHLFHQATKETSNKIEKILFCPRISGVSGSTGIAYKETTLKNIVKNILAFFGFYVPKY